MRTAISKLTRKYQATIPAPVREVLRLQAGDSIAFEIENEQIRLRKARPIDLEFAGALESTLNEWNRPEHEKAYRGL